MRPGEEIKYFLKNLHIVAGLKAILVNENRLQIKKEAALKMANLLICGAWDENRTRTET